MTIYMAAVAGWWSYPSAIRGPNAHVRRIRTDTTSAMRNKDCGQGFRWGKYSTLRYTNSLYTRRGK